MRIRKNTLKRIIAEVALSEIRLGGEGGGAAALGDKKMVAAVDGGYETPEGEYVTDSEEHPLDQLQDIMAMGVTHVDDSDGMRGIIPIEKWKGIVVQFAANPENEVDDDYGPPTRWRG